MRLPPPIGHSVGRARLSRPAVGAAWGVLSFALSAACIGKPAAEVETVFVPQPAATVAQPVDDASAEAPSANLRRSVDVGDPAERGAARLRRSVDVGDPAERGAARLRRSVDVGDPAERGAARLRRSVDVGDPAERGAARLRRSVDGPIVDLLPDAGGPALPLSWRATFNQTRPYADAIVLARKTRASFDAVAGAVAAAPDGGTPAAKAFEDARVSVERCNRAFAAAYHAPDASPVNQLDALREAADMLFGWSQRLDFAGLTHAPATYRSASAVALTFEDVAQGPVERWRQEGIALVELCVQKARLGAIDTAASRACTMMQKNLRASTNPSGGASTTRAHAQTGDAGTNANANANANGCACAYGDPLCSASMSGWCHPN